MVIQIKGTTSCGSVQLFQNGHTGQDVFRQRQRTITGSRTSQTRIPITHSIPDTRSIEIDEPLLTGNLDEDISILDLVA